MSNLDLTSKRRVGRPAERQDEIVESIRGQIVAGTLPMGNRLPTREEIGRQYGAGANTVQRALDRLKEDGFIRSSGSNGTHVSLTPPHLNRYAVVFPSNPSETHHWVRFWTALSNELAGIAKVREGKYPVYHDVDTDPTTADYRALVDDIKSHRLAGIFFAATTVQLTGSLILTEPDIPRVSIARYGVTPFPTIITDTQTFFDKAIGALAEAGCRRIATINPHGLEDEVAQACRISGDFGMETRPFWNHFLYPQHPQTAKSLAHLLMSLPASERPDGLIVSDDNLVECATSGVVAAGVRVPEELAIVAHCNFPWAASSVVPVRRLGFDARAVLHTAFDLIDAMRRHEAVPPFTNISSIFESELPKSTPYNSNK